MATAPLFDTQPPARVPAVFPTTANHIRGLLTKRFCQPEWAIFFEVASATGAGSARYADAVAMNLWPSRGLAINGFEVKISRSDWQTELKNPAKAEAMARNCDYWWIVAAKGVVRDGELPPTWGLFEVDGRGLTAKVQAPKLETPALSRTVMASLIRRCGELDSQERWRLKQEMTEQIRKDTAAEIETRVKQATRDYVNLKSAVEQFESASGLTISGWDGGDRVGRAVAIVKRVGVSESYGAAIELQRITELFSTGLKEALAAFDEAATSIASTPKRARPYAQKHAPCGLSWACQRQGGCGEGRDHRECDPVFGRLP